MTAKPPQIDPDLGNGNVSLACVGRDLGRKEVEKGKPFANKSKFSGAGYILDKALAEAGIRRQDLAAITNVVMRKPPGNNFEAHSEAAIQRGLADLRTLIDDLDPNCIVALGNEAAYALIPDWPTKKNTGRIQDSKAIQRRRGFIYEGRHGGKVVPTVHPSFVQRGAWVPFRMLLTEDLSKAKEEAETDEFRLPDREVVVPSSRNEAKQSADSLRSASRLAADIEIDDSQNLACVGFAGRRDRAVVFPARYLGAVQGLLTEGPDLIWANGQFDLHFLHTRCGIDATIEDDTQLAWHSMYPELAGKSDQTSYRMTRKSLSFLASLYTREPWWKDYSFSNDREMYELNGRDCCVTLEIMQQLDDEIDQLGVREIYEHSIEMVWPAVKMQARGLHVDDEERRRRLEKLTDRYDELAEEINEMVQPLLKERSERIEDKTHLFRRGGFETDTGYRETCPCCNGGKKKREACTTCFGVEGTGASGAILKSDLVDALARELGREPEDLEGYTKAELEELVPPCQVCDGDGKRVETWMNPTSGDQQKLVLYELLKAPRRYKSGSLTTDESALRSLLAEI